MKSNFKRLTPEEKTRLLEVFRAVRIVRREQDNARYAKKRQVKK